MPNTVRLHRVIATSPDKIFRAFVEPDALAQWLPPDGFVCTVHELDARVGGRHRASFRNFTTGDSHSFGGDYVELIPNEKLVYTDRFDDPKPAGRDADDGDAEGGVGRDRDDRGAGGRARRDPARGLLLSAGSSR